jgi:hypothetical protein
MGHDDPESGLRLEVQVGPCLDDLQAERGVDIRVGIEGQLLCEMTAGHPLRGMALVDAKGLVVDWAWTRMEEPSQQDIVCRVVGQGLWKCASFLAGQNRPLRSRDQRNLAWRLFLLEALGHLWVHREQHPELLERLLNTPLFPMVHGGGVSAEVLVRAGEGERVWFAGRDRARIIPRKQSAVLCEDPITASTLKALLGNRAAEFDTTWREVWTRMDPGAHDLLGSIQAVLGRAIGAVSQRQHLVSIMDQDIARMKARPLASGELLALKEVLFVNTRHPLWEAAERARTEAASDGTDPVLQLAAAVATAMCPEHIKPEALVSILEALAHTAIDARPMRETSHG